MGKHLSLNQLIAAVIVAVLLVSGAGSVRAVSQGTALEVEGGKIDKGATVNLTIELTNALDGLGRFDATIVSGNPKVVELVSLTPEAVSEAFLQVDSQGKSEIKFKLVDLRKKISPGDKEVELLTLKVKGASSGRSELTLTNIKYTDEEGNLIEPAVTPGELTVTSPGSTEKEEKTKTETEEGARTEETEEEKDKPAAEKKEEKQQPQQDEEVEEGAAQRTEAGRDESSGESKVSENGYSPLVEDLSLNLGESGRTRFRISSLSDGLRTAQAWITSEGGIAFEKVSFLDPAYFEVVDRTERLVNIRIADFDDVVGPGDDNIMVADIVGTGVEPGRTSIKVKKLVVWTDKGEKVVRRGDPVPVTINLGAIGRATEPPRDLDDDGLYEDVNGDGSLTKRDAFLLAFNLDAKYIKKSEALFDFNWDGSVTFADAVRLIEDVKDGE